MTVFEVVLLNIGVRGPFQVELAQYWCVAFIPFTGKRLLESCRIMCVCIKKVRSGAFANNRTENTISSAKAGSIGSAAFELVRVVKRDRFSFEGLDL